MRQYPRHLGQWVRVRADKEAKDVGGHKRRKNNLYDYTLCVCACVSQWCDVSCYCKCSICFTCWNIFKRTINTQEDSITSQFYSRPPEVPIIWLLVHIIFLFLSAVRIRVATKDLPSSALRCSRTAFSAQPSQFILVWDQQYERTNLCTPVAGTIRTHL